ncbi:MULTISPECIES: GntR family transcriptional regulator [Kocuria]|uniref:GntR family transcriptional regulator n=1 Tax=Kocuria oceani TaxID=988827 RepID=A0ABV9TM84_9MICC|nr:MULTISPECIES: GntR family transcriptional regulator [Kocuria]KLU09991.1 GntR family transcriptional regulator [Kocuria sp. SM24M-10]OLT05251.1 GntR family transcriptional regulator [Kocuria sp. CNJ-770]
MSITPASVQDEPLSLADRAFLQLQDRLIFLDIPPGAPLNEGRLSQELHLGRTPLREALKRLESEHLVVTYSRRGTFATTVDITALSEISQVREVLEPLAAQLAAERRGGGVRSQLEELRDRLANPENERLDRDEALRWDVRIHRAIYAAAGNSHLQATLERYSNLATRIWCVVADRIPELQEHITVHSALLTAVLEGDAEEAAGIMLTHVRDFETQIRQVL